MNKNKYHQKRYVEAHEITWMDTEEYMRNTLLTGVAPNNSQYSWQYVQPFAFYICQWIKMYRDKLSSVQRGVPGSQQESFQFMKLIAFDNKILP